MTPQIRWMIITAYSLTVLGCVEALEARLRGSVELPCALQSGSHSIEHLLVYWQRRLNGKEVLVAGAVRGNVTTDAQDENYRGRASLSPSGLRNGDFTLLLSALSLNDSGTYVCIVLSVVSSTIRLQEDSTELHVTAEYSTPVIASLAPSEGSAELTLTCTTQGGAPQPETRWINASDGTSILSGQIHVYQDGDFINVTSTITINVTTNLSCLILTPRGNLSSNTYMFEVMSGNSELERQREVAPTVRNSVITVVVLLIIAVLVGIVVKRRSFFSTGVQSVEYQQGNSENDEM